MKIRFTAALLLLVALATLAGNPAIHNFEAKGKHGCIRFWGGGEVWLEGRGSLLIKNLAYMNIKNEGKWERQKDMADSVQYYNFEGKMYIQARAGIHLELKGWDLSIRSKGQGEAWLQGEGTYTLNDEKGEWDNRAKENRYKKLHFKS
jgi:hypothetical protein